jgi:hypothetical protein
VDTNTEILEFLDQIEYCLSLRFKEKWRHRFSSHFISIFQDKILVSMKNQKPVKMSSLISTYTKKYKYNEDVVRDFLQAIDIGTYYPIVYDDSFSKRRKIRLAEEKKRFKEENPGQRRPCGPGNKSQLGPDY